MTKKDYELIAKEIKAQINLTYQEEETQILVDLANSLAIRFIEENPRFNRDKFIEVCGIKEWKL